MIPNPYGIQRRRKNGKASFVDDPALRSEVISLASTGMSRRGVAAAAGLPESTLRACVERGLAYPDVEPWGSFSRQYRQAERGLERAASGTIAMTVQMLHELALRGLKGEPAALERLAEQGPQLRELLNVLAARFPEDWGTHGHRKPEPEYDAQHWLDSNAMDREQLAALFSAEDVPEPLRLALQDSAQNVYRILVAGGFDPARKAEDEGRQDSGGAGDDLGQDSGGAGGDLGLGTDTVA